MIIALCALLGGRTAISPSQALEVTETPIKHVVIVIGENRSYDHVFATYVPGPGQTISNLASKGIVTPSGAPGPNFALAGQFTVPAQPRYYIAAPAKIPYSVLPAPDTGRTPTAPSDTSPPFKTLAEAAAAEPNLAATDLALLTTGASGLPSFVVDTRVSNATTLPNGPFPLTGPTLAYDAYAGDTTHRFYQMWQQSDCALANATPENPTGCLSDLYPFVVTSSSTGDHGGGNSMGFLNIAAGDAPFLKQLADQFTSSDNFHQSVMGGTGPNHIALGTGDALFFSDGNGNPITPPPAIALANPNPLQNSNNTYAVDGDWSHCADATQPGVGPVVGYLGSLPYHPAANCAPGHYYTLNNTNPGFLPTGQPTTTGVFVPPSSVRTIGDALSEKNIPWRYYGGGFDLAIAGQPGRYCQICNPFQYATSIMTNGSARAEHLKDTADFFTDVRAGTLPAVSFVKPDPFVDGHPQSSKLDLFEAYLRAILTGLDANPSLKAGTAVFVVFDEGGGYYDSGFIQPLDFFGDGPRIPFIVISPFSKGGRVVHTYADHVSILKFIERNWSVAPLTTRSRDNLPNPIPQADNPYVPANMPALGDLFDMFDFSRPLVAAVLPGSRSVQVGTPATVFATVINAGARAAAACGIALLTPIPASLLYQTTDPVTNQITGTINTPADLGAGAAQTFVVVLTPTGPIPSTDVWLSFECANTSPAVISSGLDTLLLSASTSPTPDIVALAATTTNNGIVDLGGATGAGAFVVATVNLGTGGQITASVDTGAVPLPLAVAVCQTNPATGACLSAPSPSATVEIDANATTTFAVFAAATTAIPFDPATHRLFVRFTDAVGVIRGATSVAVRTP